MKTRTHFALVCLLAGFFSVSCGKIEGESTVDNVEKINELLVLKVRFADILTGSDNDVKLTYIAKMDAYYAIDFSHVKSDMCKTNVVINGKETSLHLVTFNMPPIHLLSDPVLDREDSVVFDTEIGTGKSARRVRDAVQNAAVLWARVEAGKESWMNLARISAEDCVKELWLASKPNPEQYRFEFRWENPELEVPPPSESD